MVGGCLVDKRFGGAGCLHDTKGPPLKTNGRIVDSIGGPFKSVPPFQDKPAAPQDKTYYPFETN